MINELFCLLMLTGKCFIAH